MSLSEVVSIINFFCASFHVPIVVSMLLAAIFIVFNKLNSIMSLLINWIYRYKQWKEKQLIFLQDACSKNIDSPIVRVVKSEYDFLLFKFCTGIACSDSEERDALSELVPILRKSEVKTISNIIKIKNGQLTGLLLWPFAILALIFFCCMFFILYQINYHHKVPTSVLIVTFAFYLAGSFFMTKYLNRVNVYAKLWRRKLIKRSVCSPLGFFIDKLDVLLRRLRLKD